MLHLNPHCSGLLPPSLCHAGSQSHCSSHPVTIQEETHQNAYTPERASFSPPFLSADSNISNQITVQVSSAAGSASHTHHRENQDHIAYSTPTDAMARPKASFLDMPSFLNLKHISDLDDGASVPVMRGIHINQRLETERLEKLVSRDQPHSPESDYSFNDESDGSTTLVDSANDDSDTSSGTDVARSSSSAPSIPVLVKQQEAALREAEPELIAGHVRGANIGKPLGHEHRQGMKVGHQIHTPDWRCLAPPDVDDEQVKECREGGPDAALRALEGLPPSDEARAAAPTSKKESSPLASPASASSSSAWSNVAVAASRAPDTLQKLEGFPYDMRSPMGSEGIDASKSSCCGGCVRSAMKRVRSAFQCREGVEEMGGDGVVGHTMVVGKK